MAELHGRILGLPNRRNIAGILAILVALICAPPPSARAQGPDAERLLELARALQSDDTAGRAEAIEELSHLPASSLPAIDARVAEMRRLVVPTEDGLEAVRWFRHATGSRRADDMSDIAPGVQSVLTERRNRTTARMAERLLLIRSLEAMGRTDAYGRMMDILGIDFGPWRWEAPRIESRHGTQLLPALIEAQVHDSAGVRRWAGRAIERLGMQTPGDAIQNDDPRLQADLMRAWAKARNFDAMEVTISFVGHDDAQVRDAARWAIEQYGRNAIWQLRIAMRNQLGREADHSWGWRRTMDLLFEGLDARRTEAIETELEQGLAALDGGDLDSMREHFEEVLREEPGLPRRVEMASGYAALSSARLEEGDVEGARQALLKALRLSHDDPEASAWRAQLGFLDAEARLEAGVADAAAYREVLALDPAHDEAADRVEELTGEVVPGHESKSEQRGRSAWILAALGLLLLLPRRAWTPIRLASRMSWRLLVKHVEIPTTAPGDSLNEFRSRMAAVRDRFASSADSMTSETSAGTDEQRAPELAPIETRTEERERNPGLGQADSKRATVVDADDPELDLAALFFEEAPLSQSDDLAMMASADDTLPGDFQPPDHDDVDEVRGAHIVDQRGDAVVDTDESFDLDSLFPDGMASSPGTITSPGDLRAPDDTLPG